MTLLEHKLLNLLYTELWRNTATRIGLATDRDIAYDVILLVNTSTYQLNFGTVRRVQLEFY